MRKLTIVTIFAWLMSATVASAVTADTIFVQKLARARGTAEIRALEREFEDLKVARRACRMQIDARIAPLTCYDALTRERKWNLIARPGPTRDQLDLLCVRAAHELRLPSAYESDGLSATCKRALSRARRIVEYRAAGMVRDLN